MIRILPAFLLLAACADIPEIGRAETTFANLGTTPSLLTTEELAAVGVSAPEHQDTLAGEAASLRERARQLRAR